MTDIPKQTLSKLINNIKTKKISSEEATKAFIDRSEKSRKLNAYITDSFDRAIKKAKQFALLGLQDKKLDFIYKLRAEDILNLK